MRAAPGGGLPGVAEASAHGLTSTEVVSNAAVLLFGGIETTEGMITNAAWHLLTHPGQLDLVREGPGLLPAAVEESLRLERPRRWWTGTPPATSGSVMRRSAGATW